MSRDVITRQVVVTGRVTDAITSGAPRGLLAVAALDDSDGEPFPGLAVRILPDGHYAVHGNPAVMLPETPATLRIEASVAGYDDETATVSFTAAQLTRIDRPLDVGGVVDTARVIDDLPREAHIALQPRPVSIRGRVSEAEDPGTPIAGASISITAPVALGPVASDADGFFTIGPAPVAQTVTLLADAAGRQSLSTDIVLDFASPTNRVSLPLEPI